jgi:hypothetical protein
VNIAWSSLLQVLLVGLAAGVGVVVLYSLAIRAVAPIERTASEGPAAPAGPAAKAAAALCLLACVAIVGAGIYLIVHK